MVFFENKENSGKISKWESAVPYTVLLAPGGAKLCEKPGPVDILELRRKVLENLPSDYIGFNKYWANE
jgi:hypothetical protein